MSGEANDLGRRGEPGKRRAGADIRRGTGDMGNGWVRSESERVRGLPRDHGSRAQDSLTRMERITERDSGRHLRDFDPERTRRLEDFEIRTNPEGFLRRHEGRGLDAATEREVRQAFEARDRRAFRK